MASRRQHTIPQFYLKRFLEPGYVYRRGASEPRRTKNPRDVAVAQDFYGKNREDKVTLDDINSKIEDLGASAYEKLVDDPATVSCDDLKGISYVLANIFLRSESTIEAMNETLLDLRGHSLENAKKLQHFVEGVLETGGDPSQFLPMVYENEYEKEDEDETTLPSIDQLEVETARMRAPGGHRIAAGVTFDSHRVVANIIQEMKFLVLEAPPSHFFITSDRPITLRNRKTGSPIGAGWAISDVQASIPISPSRYLFLSHEKDLGIEQHVATPKIVEDLNFSTMLFAQTELYSCQMYPAAKDWIIA